MIYQTTNTKQNQSLKSPSTPLKTDPKTQATPSQHPSKKIDTPSRYIPPSTPTSSSPISISPITQNTFTYPTLGAISFAALEFVPIRGATSFTKAKSRELSSSDILSFNPTPY